MSHIATATTCVGKAGPNPAHGCEPSHCRPKRLEPTKQGHWPRVKWPETQSWPLTHPVDQVGWTNWISHSGGHINGAVLDFTFILWSLFITCKHGIYNYAPAASHVPAAPFLQLQFMVYITLFPMLKAPYFYISTFRRMCAVSIMVILCCSSMLFTLFLNVFDMVPVAPLITGIGFVFTFHMRCISTV